VTAVFDALAARLPGRTERGAPSAPLTTYRCGGPLAMLVRATSERDVETVGAVVAGTDVPVLVVGKGSNLLVADRGFDGVALLLGRGLARVDVAPATGAVRAGGAAALPVVARRAAAAGVGGLEFYVGIPGTVGGAVRMNAGGHGAQTRDVLTAARVVVLDGTGARDVAPGDLALGYRRSAVDARTVVVGATFQGRPEDPAACAARIDEIVRWRRAHQPGGQNAGSVFTNPPGDHAGRLIEAAGCKGLRRGDVVVSRKHANFFVAGPTARAADVVALICEVRRRVEAQSGVRLEPEVQLVGFDAEAIG
jgi:UDP-N-acetylmuramate dehydrogenase